MRLFKIRVRLTAKKFWVLFDALVDKEFKILQGKRPFLAGPCRWNGSARNFRFPCKILFSLKSKYYGLDTTNLCNCLQENTFQNLSSRLLEWKRNFADLKKLNLGSSYAIGAPTTQLKMVLCSI